MSASSNQARGDRPLIYFRCVSESHLRTPLVRPDRFTVDVGQWAYCPYDIRAKHHQWEETGGVPLENLTRQTPVEHKK